MAPYLLSVFHVTFRLEYLTVAKRSIQRGGEFKLVTLEMSNSRSLYGVNDSRSIENVLDVIHELVERLLPT